MMEDDTTSVYQLITRLCEIVLNKNGIRPHVNKENIKKARSKCFEILLSKKLINSCHYLKNNSDAMCNLLAWHFYLLWECDVPQHAEKLNLCIQKLEKLNILTNLAYSNVVLFLLQLRSTPTVQHKIMDTTINRDALQRYKKDCIYDERRFHLPDNTRKEFNVDQFKLRKDALFRSIFGSLYDCSHLNKKQITKDSEEKLIQDYCYKDEGYDSPSKDADDIWELAFHQPQNNHRTWESFGCSNNRKELPFVCESGSQCIEWLHNLKSLEKFVVGTDISGKVSYHKVSQKEFIKYVKYLLVGIESHIFTYGPNEELVLTPGTYIEGLSTSAISSYCEDLIRCSYCYKGLDNLCKTCPTNLRNEQNGYIFLELCASIKRYLSYYRVAVLSLSDMSNLLTLHQQTQSMRKHIKLLASVCKVGPFRESGEIPHGVTLLNYLYQKVTSLINKESLMVFYAVIYPCCKVYFRRFIQQWILEGAVHDPYGEFFINSNTKYIKSRGRTYWTRSYTLREDIVPDFLSDMQQDILFCGKAMNLLKLCVPNSALCLYLAEKHPNILHCCVMPDQLPAVKHNNYCYYLETTVLSGPRISLADIISRSRDQNSLFLHLVAKKRAATLIRIELERKRKLYLEFEKKQSQMNILKAQYNEAMMYKSINYATKLDQEIQSIEGDIKLQLLQNRIIEEEKAQLIEYYNQLSAVSEQRFNYYKQQIENLKCQLNSSPETEFELAPEMTQSSPESKSSVSLETETTNSYHSIYGDCESRSEHAFMLEEAPSETNNELDVINSNSDKNDVIIDKEPISENYKLYIENKKAAERNKAKVLNVEMGEAVEISVPKSPNQTELTEAQKNKLKVLSSEFGIGLCVPPKITKNVRSAAEINRTKMLASNECFLMHETLDNKTVCDNENFINKNVTFDKNINIIEMSNGLSETKALDTFVEETNQNKVKRHSTLSLDFSKLESKKSGECPVVQAIVAPKFELQKLSPMSVDSVSLSGVTTPSIYTFDNLKNTPVIPTATTEAVSENGFVFESDTLTNILNFEKRKSDFALEKHNEINLPQQISSSDVDKITPGCLKFCLQQSVLIPLITQTQLVTNELLKYYINDLHYLEHLNSLRSYFFLLDGEFCRNITEGLFGKLYDVNFPIDLINLHTLQILVYNALDYSIKFQENSDCLSFKINNLPKVFNLCDPDVFDCISLVYKISWPLNILLPVDTITKYDDIFKLLLKVHRISWVLSNMFQHLKLLGKEVEKPYQGLLLVSYHYLKLHYYRHVMTQFIQSLQSYIAGEVLHSSWHIFEKNLESVNSFDQLYALHSNYIKNILFLCLLNQKSAPLRTALQKIFVVILKFYNYLRSRCWSISDENVYIHPNFKKLESLFNNFEDLVLYFFKLGHKVVKSGYQPQLMQLLDMLDVNNYYSKKLHNSLNISSI